MKNYKVLLLDGTVGSITGANIVVGQWVETDCRDENATPVKITGFIEEILSEKYPWE